MPIIKPEVQKVLREVGLEKPESTGTLEDCINVAGLDDTEIAAELVGLAKHSGNETLRLRALETVLKVKGALKEQAPQIPTFTLILQSSDGSVPQSTQGVNPILIPRQSLKLVN